MDSDISDKKSDGPGTSRIAEAYMSVETGPWDVYNKFRFEFQMRLIQQKQIRGYAVQMNQTAYLSNRGEYTTFSVGDRTITFLTSKNLEKYIEVVEWDQGYLVVISKNKGK